MFNYVHSRLVMTKDIIQNASLFSTDLHAGLDPTSARMPNEPTSNFNNRNQVRVQDALQMEQFFFPFGIAPPPPAPCARRKQERPAHPPQKRERKQKSLRHYGEMRQHKTP